MTKNQIDEIVLEVVESYCATIDLDVDINLSTHLIGTERLLDSMGLVNVVIDIETILLDYNIEISIMSDLAMSNKISPFRTISSLSKFVFDKIAVDE